MMVVSFLVLKDAVSILTKQIQTQDRKLEAIQAKLNYAEKKLGEVNTLDDLTGCFNRRHFLELIQHHRGMAERGQYTFTVCAAEIDNFSELTEHYGRAKADEMLPLMGSIVKSALREIDSVARIDGAQFGIILAGASEDESVTILTRVNGLISQIQVSEEDPVELTASAGVAEYVDAGEDDDLYGRAVKALKYAVAQGSNRVAAHIHTVSD
jgi:diguanylate cyclase (GGDEF)-like protein